MTSNLKKIPGVEVFIEKVGKKHKIKQLKVFSFRWKELTYVLLTNLFVALFLKYNETYSHHVKGGNESRGTNNELGSTFFSIWVLAGENIFTLICSGSTLVSLWASSNRISCSWGEISTAGTGRANCLIIVIFTWHLSGHRSEEHDGSKFHYFNFLFLIIEI